MAAPNITPGRVLGGTATAGGASYTVISLEPVEVDDDGTTAPTGPDRWWSARPPSPNPSLVRLAAITTAAVVIFVVTPLILVSIGVPMVVPEYRVVTFRSCLVLWAPSADGDHRIVSLEGAVAFTELRIDPPDPEKSAARPSQLLATPRMTTCWQIQLAALRPTRS